MSLTGLLYAIGAAVTWGLVYTIDQRILRNATPLTLLFVNSLIAIIILLPFIFFERKEFAALSGTPGRVWIFIIVSAFLATLANFFIFSSIQLLGASTASIFEIAYPFFVVLFSYLAFHTAPGPALLLGGLFIFIGSAIIIASGR